MCVCAGSGYLDVSRGHLASPTGHLFYQPSAQSAGVHSAIPGAVFDQLSFHVTDCEAQSLLPATVTFTMPEPTQPDAPFFVQEELTGARTPSITLITLIRPRSPVQPRLHLESVYACMVCVWHARVCVCSAGVAGLGSEPDACDCCCGRALLDTRARAHRPAAPGVCYSFVCLSAVCLP